MLKLRLIDISWYAVCSDERSRIIPMLLAIQEIKTKFACRFARGESWFLRHNKKKPIAWNHHVIPCTFVAQHDVFRANSNALSDARKLKITAQKPCIYCALQHCHSEFCSINCPKLHQLFNCSLRTRFHLPIAILLRRCRFHTYSHCHCWPLRHRYYCSTCAHRLPASYCCSCFAFSV